MQTLSDIGEHSAIQRLTSFLHAGDDILVGAGDDCAVIRPSSSSDEDWVLTADPVVEGFHFKSTDDPRLIGRKAIGRTLSDIAAMGARPRWSLIDVVAPGDTAVEKLEMVYDGARKISDTFGLKIVGGDLSEGRGLEIHVLAIGSLPRGKALLRSGAVPGDSVFVTGELGGSAAGRHFTFEPRVQEGEFIRDWATSAIDLSDGLASDLRHVLDASNVGASIDLAEIPVSKAAEALASDDNALQHALKDGEDFELLFTVPGQSSAEFLSRWKQSFLTPALSRIGIITDRVSELQAVNASAERLDIEGWGFRHFD
jgi:thiamine-monophosphate kinase